MTPLDIVLPCYNPLPDWAERIVQSMAAIQAQLPHVELFLYIVNDGSTQNIEQAQIGFLKSKIPNFQYITYTQNRGKGYALRQGVAQTQHELCIYTDIDFPYTIESFIAMFNALKQKENDVVAGRRATDYYKNVPTTRVWISKFLKWLIKYLLNIPLTDTQCGLKGFNNKGKAIFASTEIDRYLFDLEFIFLSAQQKDLQLTPVDVTLKPNIVFSTMNFKVLWQEGRSFMKILFKSYLGLK